MGPPLTLTAGVFFFPGKPKLNFSVDTLAAAYWFTSIDRLPFGIL